MQRLTDRCPRCDQPLAISCDMWGRYYLCGGCGFTAEDDDELRVKDVEPVPAPLADLTAELSQIEAHRLHQTTTRR